MDDIGKVDEAAPAPAPAPEPVHPDWDFSVDDLHPPPKPILPRKPAPYATLLIIGICFVVWGTTRSLNASSGWPTVNPAGADWGPLTFSGQWWRMITAIFTHEGFGHLLANCFLLLFFGAHLERRLGRSTFLALFFGAGLWGSVASLLCHPYYACFGASAGLAGVMGATLVMHGLRLKSLSTKSRWKFAAVAILTLPIFRPPPSGSDIDYPAHLAGISFGMLFGLAVAFGLLAIPRLRYALTAACLTLLIAGSAWARAAGQYVFTLEDAQRAEKNGHRGEAYRLASESFAQHPSRPDLLAVVVRIFEAANSYHEEESAARAGLAHDPNDTSMLFHLANAEMNLGLCDGALRNRNRLLRLDPSLAEPLLQEGCYDARYPGPDTRPNGGPDFGLNQRHTYAEVASRLGPGEALPGEFHQWRRGYRTLCLHTLPNGTIADATETNDPSFRCGEANTPPIESSPKPVAQPPTPPGLDPDLVGPIRKKATLNTQVESRLVEPCAG